MRKALVVGINSYLNVSSLYGCVNDAYSVRSVLERNGDGTVNFSVKTLIGTSRAESVDRTTLREQVKELFDGDSDIALLYFAGHGHIETTGGYLLPSDCRTGDDGLPLADVLTFANQSRARNRVVLLDSCHSGVAGMSSVHATSDLSEGLTILTASTAEQYANEQNGAGVFTSLLVDALSGSAANLLGEITPGSVYAHIDQSLGPWDQRPVFKTNVKSFVSLRKIQGPVSLAELQQLPSFFPSAGAEYRLDPSFEPESEQPNAENNAKFATLQKFNRVNLVVPVGAPHMWHAAMQSRTCKLTVLGEHYRNLVARGRI